MNRETMDSISAMRYGMEQGLRDLKWTEVKAEIPGETAYQSPGDEVRFEMDFRGTHFTFGYDNLEGDDEVYKTFAEGDTWKEFERALLLAQAIEEEKLGTLQDLIGKWWDSFCSADSMRMAQYHSELRRWFESRNLYVAPATRHICAWRILTGHERETITNEVLKGVTK